MNEPRDKEPPEKERRSLLFFYTETPLHAGSGAGLGAIDLPLQRERLSDLPQVQGSGIKGALRELFRAEGPEADSEERLLEEALFGPRPPDNKRGKDDEDDAKAETPATQSSEHAGALAVTDARLLLLPVRTARGGWAWITSPLLLHRLARDLEISNDPLPSACVNARPASSNEALVASASAAIVAKVPNHQTKPAADKERAKLTEAVVIEDAVYEAKPSNAVAALAEWLKGALPQSDVYAPVRDRLSEQLAVLSDEEMCYWAKHGTEVVTRVRIDSDTGTVQEGALWTEEALPSESVLWSLVLVSKGRQPRQKGRRRYEQDGAAQLEEKLGAMLRQRRRMFLGGDRTVGRGLVALELRKAPRATKNGGDHGQAQ